MKHTEKRKKKHLVVSGNFLHSPTYYILILTRLTDDIFTQNDSICGLICFFLL